MSSPEEESFNDKSKKSQQGEEINSSTQNETKPNFNENKDNTSSDHQKKNYYLQKAQDKLDRGYHFILRDVGVDGNEKELSQLFKNEIGKYGNVIDNKFVKCSEHSANFLIRFSSTKEAMMNINSIVKMKVSDGVNTKEVIMEPTKEFKEYLKELSYSSDNKSTSRPHNDHRRDSPLRDKKSQNNVVIKGSVRRNEVPLEITKPLKITKRSPSENHKKFSKGYDDRMRSHSRDRDRKRGSDGKRDRYREDSYRGNRKSKSRSDSRGHRRYKRSRSKSSDRKHKHYSDRRKSSSRERFRKRSGSRGKKQRERSYSNSRSRSSENKRDKYDSRKKNSPIVKVINMRNKGDINHKDTKDRKKDNRWTDDEEDIEVVCYFIWVPSEITEVEIRDNLYKQGYSVPKLMKWKEFEGLEYLKVVYQKKEDVQLILNQSFTINDIPVLTLPKVPNKTPLEMLVHYQLRIQSSAGSIEPKTVYEYLLKFGPIADFFSLDSSTIIVTFANNSSKNRLSACHSDNTIILSDDKQLKIEFNIKPALVTRKKLINTIFYSLNQEKYRTMANPLTTTSYYGDYNPKRGNYPDPSNHNLPMMYHNYQPNPPPLTPNQQPSYNQNYYNFSNYNKSYQMPSNQNVTGNYYPPPDGTRPPDYSQMDYYSAKNYPPKPVNDYYSIPSDINPYMQQQYGYNNSNYAMQSTQNKPPPPQMKTYGYQGYY